MSTTRGRATRRLVYGLVAVFFLLRFDLWAYGSDRALLGLPWALGYHLLYTVAAFGVLALLVRFAWPSHLLDEAEPAEDPRP